MSIPPLEGLSSVLNGMQGVGSVGATAATTATTGPGSAVVPGVAAATGTSFAATLTSSLENVQRLQATTSDLAVQAATGDLDDVHDYMIAAAKSSMATEVTVAIRNKGLEAFNDIMRMQV